MHLLIIASAFWDEKGNIGIEIKTWIMKPCDSFIYTPSDSWEQSRGMTKKNINNNHIKLKAEPLDTAVIGRH